MPPVLSGIILALKKNQAKRFSFLPRSLGTWGCARDSAAGVSSFRSIEKTMVSTGLLVCKFDLFFFTRAPILDTVYMANFCITCLTNSAEIPSVVIGPKFYSGKQ